MSEREQARRTFAERYADQERDGWGPFTFEHQGPTEQARLIELARTEQTVDTSKCRTCGRPIVWAKTESGKNAPFDAAVTCGPGRFWVIGADGVARLGGAGEEGRTNHFATCRDRNEWRGKTRQVQGDLRTLKDDARSC